MANLTGSTLGSVIPFVPTRTLARLVPRLIGRSTERCRIVAAPAAMRALVG